MTQLRSSWANVPSARVRNIFGFDREETPVIREVSPSKYHGSFSPKLWYAPLKVVRFWWTTM